MSKVVRIGDDSAELIDRLGGTFDSVDDVIQRLAEEAGYEDEMRAVGIELEDEDSGQLDEPVDVIALSDFESAGDSQADVMEDVVTYLIEEHDLLQRIELPYVPTGKKALLNDEPYHPDGSEMKQARELPSEVYLGTQYDKPTKEARIYSLANECNVELAESDW